jgi:hypothetical protein
MKYLPLYFVMASAGFLFLGAVGARYEVPVFFLVLSLVLSYFMGACALLENKDRRHE